LPGSSPHSLAARVRRLAGWAGVAAEVRLDEGAMWPGSRVTSPRGRPFRLLRQAIQETWRKEGEPDVPVVPFMLSGATDSKHYANLTYGGVVLRFVPYGMNKTAGELGLIHGTNERIRASYFARAVCTYGRVFELFGSEERLEEQGEGEGRN
ncbi:hypothetical protein Agub_g8604, partial [Astrephomene gubernaculifera]